MIGSLRSVAGGVMNVLLVLVTMSRFRSSCSGCDFSTSSIMKYVELKTAPLPDSSLMLRYQLELGEMDFEYSESHGKFSL